MVRQVSGDRLRHEFNLILAEQQPQPVLARLADLNLLSAIHPILSWPTHLDAVLETILRDELPPGWQLPEKIGNLTIRQALAYMVWFLQYPLDDAISVGQRLRLPGSLLESLKAAAQLSEEIGGLLTAPPSQAATRLDLVPHSALFSLDLVSTDPAVRQFLARYIHTWQQVWPSTDGNHLHAMGLPPGPLYREILSALRAAWLDGEIHSADDEQRLLEDLVKTLGNPEDQSL
jgi:tRNA nucleotidyltransferase (CCA-adding enzyme)